MSLGPTADAADPVLTADSELMAASLPQVRLHSYGAIARAGPISASASFPLRKRHHRAHRDSGRCDCCLISRSKIENRQFAILIAAIF